MNKLSRQEILKLIDKSHNYRKTILKMMLLGEAHVGGAFSCIDIINVLYNKILKFDPKDPKWDKRDRFILSAGHKGIAQYVVLQDAGYFDEEILWTWESLNSRIPMHPDEKALPGIEFPTGALGHGLSFAGGMALAAKLDNKDHRIFVLLGDGECAEGSVWEAVMAAGHYKLDNLSAIIDRNGLQVNGRTFDIMDSSPLEEKFKSFGWQVKTINGHDFSQIFDSLSSVPFLENRPSLIIADTIKCKGIDFSENTAGSHHCHWDDKKIEEANKSLDKVKANEVSNGR
ncbi:MAG: transketolase [Candidatus Humimicrobiaceae bacterium]